MGMVFGILHAFQSVCPPHGQWPPQWAAGEYPNCSNSLVFLDSHFEYSGIFQVRTKTYSLKRGDMYTVKLEKVGSIYWGKFAQGPIQMLPIWDNNIPKGIVFGNQPSHQNTSKYW